MFIMRRETQKKVAITLLALSCATSVVCLIVFLCGGFERRSTGVTLQPGAFLITTNMSIGARPAASFWGKVDGNALTMTAERESATKFEVTTLDDKDNVLTLDGGSRYLALSGVMVPMAQIVSASKTRDRCIRLSKSPRGVYEFDDRKQCFRAEYRAEKNMSAPIVVGVAPCTKIVASYTKLKIESY